MYSNAAVFVYKILRIDYLILIQFDLILNL